MNLLILLLAGEFEESLSLNNQILGVQDSNLDPRF